MLDRLDGPWRIIASVILFPVFFQENFIEFAWGANDPEWMMLLKRFLILLPTLALIFGCWATVVSLFSIIIRQSRRDFMANLFITWWGLGRAIFAFWGGILKFIFQVLGWIGGFIRIFIFGILLLLKDTILLPVRIISDISHGSFKPGIPWIALNLMMVWALLEALIFTIVMTPLIQDVMGALAGTELGGWTLQVPLYLTFCIFVLGSYSVLYSFGEAIQKKEWFKVANYFLVEVIVALVEVVFFYREFVDALVPWFAQHAGQGFELGIFGTLGIAFAAWLGIRAMTWFLFGAAATPFLMAMMHRSGLAEGTAGGEKKSLLLQALRRDGGEDKKLMVFIHEFIQKIKEDMDWVEEKGHNMLSALLIPPLHIVAACLNFCSLILTNQHLFELPFETYKDLVAAKSVLTQFKKST